MKKVQRRKIEKNRRSKSYNSAKNTNNRKEYAAAKRRQEKHINRELESEIEYV